MIDVTPKLWSDFDGTAVSLAKKTNRRNWPTYILSGIEGYAEFLRGTSSTGVEVAGVASRRPNILLSRIATTRSIAKLGVNEFFTNPSQIVLKGSEQEKGRFIAEQSKTAPVGMLEDKPHRLGAVLLGILKGSENTIAPHFPVVLGVVSHRMSQQYIERLAEHANTMASDNLYIEETGGNDSYGLSIRGESTSLDVIQLKPYSNDSGQEFGQTLIATGVGLNSN